MRASGRRGRRSARGRGSRSSEGRGGLCCAALCNAPCDCSVRVRRRARESTSERGARACLRTPPPAPRSPRRPLPSPLDSTSLSLPPAPATTSTPHTLMSAPATDSAPAVEPSTSNGAAAPSSSTGEQHPIAQAMQATEHDLGHKVRLCPLYRARRAARLHQAGGARQGGSGGTHVDGDDVDEGPEGGLQHRGAGQRRLGSLAGCTGHSHSRSSRSQTAASPISPPSARPRLAASRPACTDSRLARSAPTGLCRQPALLGQRRQHQGHLCQGRPGVSPRLSSSSLSRAFPSLPYLFLPRAPSRTSIKHGWLTPRPHRLQHRRPDHPPRHEVSRVRRLVLS